MNNIQEILKKPVLVFLNNENRKGSDIINLRNELLKNQNGFFNQFEFYIYTFYFERALRQFKNMNIPKKISLTL